MRGMLAGIPPAFALSLDARAVHRYVQLPPKSLVRDGDGYWFLTATHAAVAWHRPVEPNGFKRALRTPSSASKSKPKDP